MQAGCSRNPDDVPSLSASPRTEFRAITIPPQGAIPREPCLVTVPNRNGGVFGELKPLDDPLEIIFARAEGLHAHGHSAEACELGIQLATELLANPPDLLVELPHVVTKSGNKKKTNPACHQISCLASATLAKCAFSARFWQRIQIFTTSPSELEKNVWIGTGSTTSHYKAIRSQTGSSRVRVGDAVEENSSG